MDLLTGDTTGAAVVVGVLAPWLIAAVNRPNWSKGVRQGVAVAVSALLGLGIAYAAGTFRHGWTIVGAAATVLVTSQAVYGRLFTGTLRKFERLTSGRSCRREGTTITYGGDRPGRHARNR